MKGNKEWLTIERPKDSICFRSQEEIYMLSQNWLMFMFLCPISFQSTIRFVYCSSNIRSRHIYIIPQSISRVSLFGHRGMWGLRERQRGKREGSLQGLAIFFSRSSGNCLVSITLTPGITWSNLLPGISLSLSSLPASEALSWSCSAIGGVKGGVYSILVLVSMIPDEVESDSGWVKSRGSGWASFSAGVHALVADA